MLDCFCGAVFRPCEISCVFFLQLHFELLMSYCSKCENSLPTDGGLVLCNGCRGEMHYECAKLKSSTYSGMSSRRKLEWRCEFCRLASKIAEIILPKIDSSFLSSIVAPIKEEFSDLKLKIGECLESQLAIGKKYDDLIVNYKRLDCTINNLKKEIDDIRSTSTSGELSAIHNKLNKYEQDQLKNVMVMYDVEEREDENLFETVGKVCDLYNINIQKEDVSDVRRIFGSRNKLNNTEKKSRPIKVTFKSHDLMRKILDSRKNKVITNSDLFEGGLKERIKMYEMLTSFNRKLLYQARLIAGERQWKYVWFSYGQLKCRKADGSKVFTLNEEKDLDKMI